jgi:hypothetical protein
MGSQSRTARDHGLAFGIVFLNEGHTGPWFEESAGELQNKLQAGLFYFPTFFFSNTLSISIAPDTRRPRSTPCGAWHSVPLHASPVMEGKKRQLRAVLCGSRSSQ